MIRAAIYSRVSSLEQASAEHVSLQVQEQRCLAYVEQHGWSLVANETDTESGLRPSRAGYQRILEMARRHAVDKIVVYQASRFGRKASEVLVRTEELRELGVDLVSTAEDLSSFLMLGIQAVMNEEESRRLSARVGPAKRLKASRGYWLGHAPFGTVNEKGILREGPHFDLVRLAFQLVTEGVAVREINRRINAAVAPRALDLSTVRKMVRNPAYVGRVVWDDVDVVAQWAPLIDPDLFQRAGAALTRRYRERAPISPSYPFWIVGLARCGRCGAAMHPKIHVRRWGTKYAYLICGRRDRVNVSRGCRPEHFPIEAVQDWFIDELQRALPGPDDAGDVLALLEAARERTAAARGLRASTLQAERSRLAGRLQAAKAAHLDAPEVFTIADVKQVERAVRDNLSAIDIEIAAAGVVPVADLDIDELRRFIVERQWLELRTSDPAAFRTLVKRVIGAVDVHDRGEYAIAWLPAMAPVLVR